MKKLYKDSTSKTRQEKVSSRHLQTIGESVVINYKILHIPLMISLASEDHFPIRFTLHSCWQRGHRLFCFTHRDIQQLWKTWLQSPQTTTQSSARLSFWHRRHASMTCTRQMAQVSHSTSQLQIPTRFHFFKENTFDPDRSGFWPGPDIAEELLERKVRVNAKLSLNN